MSSICIFVQVFSISVGLKIPLKTSFVSYDLSVSSGSRDSGWGGGELCVSQLS